MTAIAQKAANACRSIGVALRPCTVPEAGKPTFEIAEDELEMGMGIHGEPGIWRGKLRPADELAAEMLQRVSDELDLVKGDRVSVLVNSLGATPHEELFILYRHIANALAAKSVSIIMPLVGRYATSMEMTGASLSLIKLDAELEQHLKAPARCAFWSVA